MQLWWNTLKIFLLKLENGRQALFYLWKYIFPCILNFLENIQETWNQF